MLLPERKRPELFKTQIEGLKADVHKHRWIKAFLSVSAIVVPLTSFFTPQASRQQHHWNYLLGLSSAIAATTVYKLTESEEKEFEAFQNMAKEHFKTEASYHFDVNAVIQQVERKNKIASYLLGLPKTEQRVYHGAELGLLNLMFPPQIPDKPVYSEDDDDDVVTPKQGKARLQAALNRLEQQNSNITLSWINTEFIRNSKVVVGAKGSGKSVFMRYEGARCWLEQTTEQGYPRLFIYDPHYDIDDKSKHWLTPISQQYLLDNKMLVKSVRQGYQLFIDAANELQRRIKGISKDRDLFKIYADEFETFKRATQSGELKNEEFQRLISIIMMIQDEGRKYNVECCLGLKSLKKENTGLDSSTIAQMDWLLFERAAYDPTTRFPSDFDQKYIKEQATALRENKPANLKARIVVVLLANADADAENHYVTYLPLLNPPKISNWGAETDEETTANKTTDTPSNAKTTLNVEPKKQQQNPQVDRSQFLTLIKELKEVCEDCKNKTGNYPTALQLLNVWEKITGKQLNEEGLNVLIQHLGIMPSDWE